MVNYDGKVRLLELAQVPKDKVGVCVVTHRHLHMLNLVFQVDEFKSVSKFKLACVCVCVQWCQGGGGAIGALSPAFVWPHNFKTMTELGRL